MRSYNQIKSQLSMDISRAIIELKTSMARLARQTVADMPALADKT